MRTIPNAARSSFLMLAGAMAGIAACLFFALASYRTRPDLTAQFEFALLAALMLALLAILPLKRLARHWEPSSNHGELLRQSDQQEPRTDKPLAYEYIGPVSESSRPVADALANDGREAYPNADQIIGADTSQALHLPADTQAALLRDIIDQLPYPIFALDSNNQVLFVNAALAALYGTTPQKLAQSKADGHLRRLSSDDLLSRPAGDTDGEEWLTTYDGEERRFLVQRLPFNSLIQGELVVAVDVTELHKLQLQLQFSQRLEVLGTLAGGIAHDFNNLLTPILGYASILLESNLEPEHHRKVDAIASAADRARMVAQQMLSFSRQNEDFSVREQVDLVAIIQEAVTFMRASVPPNIDIQVQIDAAPWIHADSGQIHQVLVNLCTNASQAISAPNGRVTVHCDQLKAGDRTLPATLSNQDCALVQVIDNGMGMSSAVMSHVFEPFFTTKEVGEGSGLGLSIVKGIVGRHGGIVEVTGNEPSGTCFSVYLPCESKLTFDATETTAESRLLLVDDDAMVLRVLEDLLITKGYSVSAFSNPKEALAQLTAAPDQFDVLITDNNMPKLKGVDLARQAREAAPTLPIILITGYAKPTETELSSISRNLMKPVSTKDLTDAIRQVTTENQAA